LVVILGLGIDLLENSRVERELARGDWLLGDGIFTREEIRHCSGSREAALGYAACFAAKETPQPVFSATSESSPARGFVCSWTGCPSCTSGF
jgi:phosphopantetheinyl transferase (holo-ACP synthase)